MKTVPVVLRVWAKREKAGHITIKLAGPFISTVRDKPGDARHHRHLFNYLKRVLLENRCWPRRAEPYLC
jgi:hypothetical protein